MTIRVYNTLTRKKEVFEPIEPGKVRMYVCGPTVYDSSHIGHARSTVVFDVIVRYFAEKGFAVTHVRNFTDVDDKIIQRAKDLGMDPQALADRYIDEFHEDMDALNVRRATLEPRATEYIGHIVRVIEKLIEKGMAYRVEGDIYFPVEKFKEYGKLSGRKFEDMEAGARVNVDERKKNPFDFALWKAAKPGEPAWESPWGKGRPGWHIECTAMSSVLLGETFDIHGGGQDLIFPHHENEIAQSEAAFEKPFVRYWLHNGFVNINQEKMSKSLGNFLMIRDALKTYHPEAIRLFLLSSHYRSPVDFSEEAMSEADTGLEKVYAALGRAAESIGPPAAESGNGKTGRLWNLFCEAMDDDFNTARGIGYLFDAVRTLNRLLDEEASLEEIRGIRVEILKIGKVLGILDETPDVFFQKRREKALSTKTISPEEIESLIRERVEARAAKDFKKADQIRKQLADQNIILEDRPEGTIWKMK